MGIKALTEHFNILHIVHKEKGIIFVGSEFCTKLFSINEQTGVINDNVGFDGICAKNYPELSKADPKKIVELLQEQDEFEQNLICYKVENGEVKEKLCETFGFPNVTHEGELMYENTIFLKREDAINNAKKNLSLEINYIGESITELEEKLAHKTELLKKKKEELLNLS